MHRRTALAAALLLSCCLTDAAQQTGKTADIEGDVREYEPGKTITIVIRPQVAQTYDLTDKDTRYEIGPGVTPGSKVVATESRDAEGRKVVRIFVKA